MADESANFAAEVARAAIDLSVSATTTGFTVSLKIDNTVLAGIISVGALSLGAFYLANRRPVENAIRNGLENRNEAGMVDPEVRNIEQGSIFVELYCHSERSFLQFVEDFEAKKVEKRLEEELTKIGFQQNLQVTIRNADEVGKKATVLRHSQAWINTKEVEGPAYMYLEILEQPKQRGYRFRSQCEGSSHSGLPGQYSEKGKKSYPSVQLCNYQGLARIVVSLVTVDEPPMPHAHSLIGENSNDGVVMVQIGPEDRMVASFPSLGIQHVTKKDLGKVLTDRYMKPQNLHMATVNTLVANSKGFDKAVSESEKYTFDITMAKDVEDEESQKIRQMVEKQKQNMNLNVVRLCFQVYLPDDSGCFTKALPPCFSNPVYDSKSPSTPALKICRMHRHTGCVTGGEEIYLLCDRVQKDDIEVVFYEMNFETGKRVWEARGVFSPTDVHRQVAIVFKTPPYWNRFIERPVKVLLELRRKSDGETSQSIDFTYEPQKFDETIPSKRHRKIPHFSDYFGGKSGGGALDEGGGSSGSFEWFRSLGPVKKTPKEES